MKSIKFLLPIFMVGQIINAQNNKELLTTALSKYSTGNSFSSAGNFVSISTADQTLKGSIFFLDPNQRKMYTLEVSAGALGGISALFDEGELNTNASVGGDMRWLSKNWSNIAAQNEDEVRDIDKDIQLVQEDYDKKLTTLITLVLSDGKKAFKKDKIINKQLNLVDSLLKKVEKTKFEKDSTNIFHQSMEDYLEDLMESLKDKRNITTDLAYFNREKNYLNAKRLNQINALNIKKEELSISALKLHYWSIGYSAKRDDFKLFVDSLEVNGQLISQDYITQEVRFSYNLITNLENRGKGSIAGFGKRKFLSLAAVFNYTSNLSGLEKVEVIDTKVIDSVMNRTSVKRQNAFEGEFIKDIATINFIIDYYTYLSKEESSLALHLNPEVLLSDFKKPVTSFQFGFLIPFKDKKEQKTRVNLEFFYKIKDVFKTTNSTNSLLNRNQIGIQTTFPFSF